MRIWRVLLVVVCVFVLAVAAAGCGGGGGGGGGSSKSSGLKPEAWATSVCTALGDWVRGLQTSSAKLQTDLRGSKSLPEVKAKFVAFLQDATDRAKVMVAAVRSTGAPDVTDGAALQRDFEAAVARFQTSFERATSKAKGLPTNNPQVFTTGVQSLGQEVQTSLSATRDVFTKLGDKYKNSNMDTTTKSIPACERIGAS